MKKLQKHLKQIITIIIMVITFSQVAFATSFQNLKLYSGTINLMRDATTALMVGAPIVCALCILFFQIRKSAADQQEQQIWSKRTKTAIISCVIAFGASGIVNLLATYYSG